MKMPPPDFWVKFLRYLAGVDRRLAGELWNVMYPTELHQVGYQISRILDAGPDLTRTQHFGQVVTPALLMTLCVRVSPENGRSRRKDVRTLESAILDKSRGGEWR
jgi:hypothetical protein